MNESPMSGTAHSLGLGNAAGIIFHTNDRALTSTNRSSLLAAFASVQMQQPLKPEFRNSQLSKQRFHSSGAHSSDAKPSIIRSELGSGSRNVLLGGTQFVPSPDEAVSGGRAKLDGFTRPRRHRERNADGGVGEGNPDGTAFRSAQAEA
eukprot:CAMPEP_0172164416 /NCGR_PEP_ID=MMETSP1050-20130122/7834_1 /TAXON_ID=233186 /ORGANISM="Cryptomonas curvata, Strain CCAP979/52" /LENGTH=148 /DNA_ID=CAMNT_0012834753 /DNA_START=127 /DNA_END=570 /DNA_ORIENTATION=+